MRHRFSILPVPMALGASLTATAAARGAGGAGVIEVGVLAGGEER